MNVFSNKSKKICWPQVHFRFSDLFPLLNRNSRTCSAFVHIKHAKLAQKLYPNGFAYELQKKREENTEDQQPQHQHIQYKYVCVSVAKAFISSLDWQTEI